MTSGGHLFLILYCLFLCFYYYYMFIFYGGMGGGGIPVTTYHGSLLEVSFGTENKFVCLED